MSMNPLALIMIFSHDKKGVKDCNNSISFIRRVIIIHHELQPTHV